MANPTENIGQTAGDVVIGSSDPSKSIFTSMGKRLEPSLVRVIGTDEQINAQAQAMLRNAMSGGGRPMPAPVGGKKRKGKAAEKQGLQYLQVVEPAPWMAQAAGQALEAEYNVPVKPVQQLTVQFENNFGRMKAKIEEMLEHDMAFLLTFTNEDAMVFEPSTGDKLWFYTPDRDKHRVYYPGVTFDSLSSTKKYMILFKCTDEEEE